MAIRLVVSFWHSGRRVSWVKRILEPSPFVRWLWAEHRPILMAFVCGVAPPVFALAGFLLIFLIGERPLLFPRLLSPSG